jgi:Tol biopolymer transport system component
MDIYTAMADGTQRTLVARGRPLANAPLWLPNGRRIAYTNFGEKDDLWIVDAVAREEPRPVTKNGKWKTQMLSWSPDGEFAIFDDLESNGTGSDVYCVDTTTGEVVNLTPGSPAWDAQPAWSPDGQWIAFFSNRGADKLADIWLVRPDGTELRNLTNNGKYWEDIIPAWSPDGRQLAFFRYARDAQPGVPGGPPGLWIMDADGANQRLVVELEGEPCFEPLFWSPDGRRIAYTYPGDEGKSADCEQGQSDVWVVEVAGGKPVNVSPMPSEAVGISWSPDSRALTFTKAVNDELVQYVAAADGSDTWRFLDDENAFLGQWQPAAKPLAAVATKRPCASPPTATPATSPAARAYPGLIAYSGPPGRTVDIYTVKPDGTQHTRLTQGWGIALYPRWSPDGRIIAYLI